MNNFSKIATALVMVPTLLGGDSSAQSQQVQPTVDPSSQLLDCITPELPSIDTTKVTWESISANRIRIAEILAQRLANKQLSPEHYERMMILNVKLALGSLYQLTTGNEMAAILLQEYLSGRTDTFVFDSQIIPSGTSIYPNMDSVDPNRLGDTYQRDLQQWESEMPDYSQER